MSRPITNGEPRDAEVPPLTEALGEQLHRHARQQEAVARLGQVALRERDLSGLFSEVVSTVACVLDVHLCAILELQPDGRTLQIIADVGLKDRPRMLPAGTGTQAGYALKTRLPVVTDDFAAEQRFDTRSLLRQGMISGFNSIIEGPERPFGVLGAHTNKQRSFSANDVNFLVAVANLLSAAVAREHEERLCRHAAMHDPLTGLPNRALALDRLELALARRCREGIDVAMITLDLDRFRVINDSLGHAAGDQVLVELAGRLQRILRPTDTIARLSGGAFAIVCESHRGPRQLVALVERIRAAVSRPLELPSGDHVLSASIGVAAAENSDDTSASLLRDADTAMYRAKSRAPGSYELFDATLRSEVLVTLRAEQELRQALSDGQLCVHYQPIIDIAAGRPVSIEALVRWEHPERGLIAPAEFIPVAEETGLILALGRHVLQTACAQAAAWQQRFDTPLQMFVNISGSQLKSPHFPEEVRDIASATQIRPGTLGLEVTESVLIEDLESANDTLNSFREHGVRLLLDDFGTGYSSLSYLKRLPLAGVKVDRSFIDGLESHQQNRTILRAIIEMCHALGMPVVGEGVECSEQLKRLSELGCEHAQGYLLCRPSSAQAIGSYLESRLADPASYERRNLLALPA